MEDDSCMIKSFDQPDVTEDGLYKIPSKTKHSIIQNNEKKKKSFFSPNILSVKMENTYLPYPTTAFVKKILLY